MTGASMPLVNSGWQKKDIVGRARLFLPYVGIVKIIMNEYPKFKYAVLACLGFYVLIHWE